MTVDDWLKFVKAKYNADYSNTIANSNIFIDINVYELVN